MKDTAKITVRIDPSLEVAEFRPSLEVDVVGGEIVVVIVVVVLGAEIKNCSFTVTATINVSISKTFLTCKIVR